MKIDRPEQGRKTGGGERERIAEKAHLESLAQPAPATEPDIRIRPALAGDLDAVHQLLTGASLPVDGIAEHFPEGFAVAEVGERIVGAEGVECHGDDGLLRSAVVHPEWRGRGIGELLTVDRLRWAREAGRRELWLLTTTASAFFPRFGFVETDRHLASDALRRSREFAESCPASATAMRLRLAD